MIRKRVCTAIAIALLCGAVVKADTYPDEAYPTDSALLGLSGTVDDPTGISFIAIGTNPNSTPSLAVQLYREQYRENGILAAINQGRVADEGGLAYGVYPIVYYQAGVRQSYAGATGQAAVDDDVNHVWIDTNGALQAGTNGFPTDTQEFLPLGKITTVGGDISAIVDERVAVLFATPAFADQIDLAADVTGTLPVASGGSGATTLTGVLHGNGTSAFTAADVDLTAEVTGVLVTSNGGSGAATLTGVLHGNGTSPFTAGDVDLTSEVTGTLPVANGGSGAATLTGVLHGNGASAFTAADVDLTSEVTGTLPVANGGSGAATLTGVLHGNGASAFTAADVDLTSEVTGTLPVGNGGSGAASLVGVLYGNGAGAYTATPILPVALGGTGAATLTGVLHGNGTSAFTAADVDLTSEVTGTLPTSQGGTGTTTLRLVPVAPMFYIAGGLSVKTYEIEAVYPTIIEVKSARGRVATAPVGATLRVDVLDDGASIFDGVTGDMINIASGTQQDVSAVVNEVVAAGSVITIQVEQVGSSTAGSDLTVTLDGRVAFDG